MALDQTKDGRALSSAELAKQREEAVDAMFRNPDNTIVPVDLEVEMKQSFIDYAMSVITDRALPDVRDGLKPVHRRILYSMFTQGFTPDKPYRKSATTVGDVIGRFHPHGDAAVYDTMVRLAQDFSMRHELVDGHGNFGSRDGDPPAAYRYTEARLTKLALEMMNDINKDTVDFQPNFDEHAMEPVVLPAGFPNLLVNGTTGIAVGMATNIPPHNLGESIDAAIYIIDHPDATADDLLPVIPGPDFPTGAAILGMSGIRQAYRTGRGRVVVRAHCDIEEMRGNRFRIVVRDLPYQVNKARLIERIAQLMKEKRIDGISDVRDESDRNEAVRVVIELKRDATPQVVLNQLYRHTQLQDSFSINMLALVQMEDGIHYEPKIVNLVEALTYFVNHKRDVCSRRVRFDLEKTEARRHIVEGLQLAIDHIDEVINIIRASANENVAKENLMARFGFTEKQAQHVVDMRLGRLSGLEREKLEAEYKDLCEKIAWFKRLLSEPELMNQLMKDELLDIKRKYANERRTVIERNSDFDIDDESLIEEEQVVITLSHFGYVKRMPVDVYQAQHRGGRGITAMQTREEDFVEQLFITSTHDRLLVFTTRGKVYQLKGYQIPEASRQARGMPMVNLLQLENDEKVYTLIPISPEQEGGALMMATRQGFVKKTLLSDYNNINRAGIIAISLRPDDEVCGIELTQPEHDILLLTKSGMAIRFDEADVRLTGRNTQGVKGITLMQDDDVIGMVACDEEQPILFVTENGFGKRTDLADYRRQNRGGKGLLSYRCSAKTGYLVAVAKATEDKDVLLINDLGVVIRLNAAEIPILSRVTQGVTLMRSREGKVVDMAVVDHADEETADENVTQPSTAEATATTESTSATGETDVTADATTTEVDETN